MKISLKSNSGWRAAGAMALLFASALIICQSASADNPHVLTVMTRNMDAGTDLNYVLAATDLTTLFAGTAATLAEVKASGIPARAARLADEIAAQMPDLIALQEVTLWRTGPIMQPPATAVLYDQLDLLMAELNKRKLHYGVVASQSLLDAEAPVPDVLVDLRMTDRNVVLARIDLPQSQFSISNVQTHNYTTFFEFGSPLLGDFKEPTGWISMDVDVQKTKTRFVNTHLESTGVPGGDVIQAAQLSELMAALASPGMPLILAGDFNANAEPGPEHTGTVEKLVAAGYTDAWRAVRAWDPGFTWPLFGEDQASGPANPNERIDLIFTAGGPSRVNGHDAGILSVERTGTNAPWASDHAGVVMKWRVK